MAPINIVVVVAALLTAGVLLSKPMRASATWRATMTPLASIIGSGFLVVGPLLAQTIGREAIWGMLGLTVAAYGIGEVIRFNIAELEPKEEGHKAGKLPMVLEKSSDWALTFAYMVSVGYYATLLGAFFLSGVGVGNDSAARLITTAVLVFIGWFGWHKGLKALENLEVGTVALNMAAIAALIVGLAYGNTQQAIAGTWEVTLPSIGIGREQLQVLLGLLVLVQGFETSRYLGDEYDAPTRIRTMRYAQLLSMGIYVVFIGLATVYFDPSMPTDGGETAILGVCAKVALVLPALISLSAVTASFSASVADTSGGGGLLKDLTSGRIIPAHGYGVICGVALGLVWTMDVYALISYASKAFAFYYALQCVLGCWFGWRKRRWFIVMLSGVCVIMCLAVVFFGIAAEG